MEDNRFLETRAQSTQIFLRQRRPKLACRFTFIERKLLFSEFAPN